MLVEPSDIVTVALRVSPATWAYLCYVLYAIILLLLMACTLPKILERDTNKIITRHT